MRLSFSFSLFFSFLTVHHMRRMHSLSISLSLEWSLKTNLVDLVYSSEYHICADKTEYVLANCPPSVAIQKILRILFIPTDFSEILRVGYMSAKSMFVVSRYYRLLAISIILEMALRLSHRCVWWKYLRILQICNIYRRILYIFFSGISHLSLNDL